MNKIITFIDNLYESINIYQTLILYDKENIKDKYDITHMKNLLTEKDYPICIIDEDYDDILLKENKFRVFIIDINVFLNNKELDLTKVTVILCLDEVTHKKINNYLDNNGNKDYANDFYIFSINNI